MSRRSVDLPQPLGPTSETSSPARERKRNPIERRVRRSRAIVRNGKAFADVAERGATSLRWFHRRRRYHLIIPFCQTSTRSRTLKSTVMIVEKNAAMMTSAA